ncbi:MAG: PAS domain-containing protein, partial [Pirellulaceae bacterium]|nr:PAS domain-containing protein [Pirellulaceae bacterium]
STMGAGEEQNTKENTNGIKNEPSSNDLFEGSQIHSPHFLKSAPPLKTQVVLLGKTLDLLPHAVWLLDHQMNVLFANGASKDFFPPSTAKLNPIQHLLARVPFSSQSKIQQFLKEAPLRILNSSETTSQTIDLPLSTNNNPAIRSFRVTLKELEHGSPHHAPYFCLFFENSNSQASDLPPYHTTPCGQHLTLTRELSAQKNKRSTIAELGQLALSDMPHNKFMVEALRRISETLEMTCCGIFSYHPAYNRLVLKHDIGWEMLSKDCGNIEVSEQSVGGATFIYSTLHAIDNLSESSEFIRTKTLCAFGVTGVICAPICDLSGPIGILATFNTTGRKMSPDDISLVQTVANLLGQVIYHHRSQRLLGRQNHILQQLTTNTPLTEILGYLCKTTEEQAPDTLCSIIEVQDQEITEVTAPSFPDSYIHQIKAQEIGHFSGAHGAAIFYRQRNLCTNIKTDPHWRNLQPFATRYQIRSAWAEPIFSSEGEILGAFVIHNPLPLYPTAQNITLLSSAANLAGIAIEHRRDIEALKKTTSNLKAIFQAYPDLQVRVLQDGTIVEYYASPRAQALYAEHRALQGKKIQKAFPQPAASKCLDAVQKAISHQTIEVIEYVLAVPNGERVYEARHIPLSSEEVVIIIRDTTKKSEAERAFKESEERVQQIANSINDIFWLSDWEKDCLTFLSPAYETIFGYSCEMLLSGLRTWSESIHPEDRPRVEKQYRTQTKHGSLVREYRIIRPDNTIRWIRDRAFPIFDSSGKLFRVAGIAQDITEWKLANKRLRDRENELAHASRLSTMGELAAEMAHEINQPLYAISNLAEACKTIADTPEDDSSSLITEWTTEIANQANRAGDIVRRINRFLRKPASQKELYNFHKLLEGIRPLLEVNAKANAVTIEYDLDDELPSLPMEKILIEQVLVNLIHNSIEAMKEIPAYERILKVTCRYKRRQPHQQARSQTEEKDAIEVAVADRGHGIAPEISSSLFEPFFTTKKKGLGMGLSICRTSIEFHGGTLTAENNPDLGATFRFTLPVNDLQSLPLKAAPTTANLKHAIGHREE